MGLASLQQPETASGTSSDVVACLHHGPAAVDKKRKKREKEEEAKRKSQKLGEPSLVLSAWLMGNIGKVCHTGNGARLGMCKLAREAWCHLAQGQG